MFRDKMKFGTIVMLALSLLFGELAFSAPVIASAASQPASPVAATPLAAARWVRCNVDGDNDADDWCWVNNARYNYLGNGYYLMGNGYYILRNGQYVFMGNAKRLAVRGKLVLPNGVVVRNGYLMYRGRVIGVQNYLGYPYYYYVP